VGERLIGKTWGFPRRRAWACMWLETWITCSNQKINNSIDPVNVKEHCKKAAAHHRIVSENPSLPPAKPNTLSTKLIRCPVIVV
jgi:hypothetical protein